MSNSGRVWRRLPEWLRRRPERVRVGLLVVTYILLGLALEKIASLFETSWQVSPWDPAAGLHVVMLLGFGLRYALALPVIPFLAALIFSPGEKAAWLTGLLAAGYTTLAYSAASALLLYKLHVDPRLYKLRDVVWFLITFIVATLVASIAYILSLVALGNVDQAEWGQKLLHDWAGEATGIAMLAPPLLIWLRSFPWSGKHLDLARALPQFRENLTNWRSPNARQVLQWGGAIALLLVASWASYGGFQTKSLDFTYLIFLPLVWVASHHGFDKVVWAVLLINVSSVIFVGSRVQSANTLALQFGLMAVSFTGVLLGAFVTERQQELTKRQQTEQQLYYDATHDKLTGLYNRTWFTEKLQAVEQDTNLFAVLFLDLDRFKVINDSLGHLIGDQMLVAVARRLQNCLNEEAVAHFGGDEFTVLLEDIEDINGATCVAQHLCEELAQPFNVDDYELFTTVSIGIVPSSIEHQQAEELIRDADIAMYRAKEQGPGHWVLFDQTMHDQIVGRSQLENDLRQALRNQEFQLYYQPLVDLKIGRINGFEALLRWQHATRGFIPPHQFIPVAEATGLINPLGYWVFKEACRQMHDWQLTFPELSLTISVNLSVQQLLQPNLLEDIDQVLQETGLSPGSLRLEITESVMMENSQNTAAILLQMSRRGIRLAIDDFGTGYSSLSRLCSFSVNTLKIDRSFINQIDSREQLEIVRASIMLAHSLGIDVTAEGVETAAQLSTLRTLGCEEGQGYYFARPMTSQAAQDLLAAAPQW